MEQPQPIEKMNTINHTNPNQPTNQKSYSSTNSSSSEEDDFIQIDTNQLTTFNILNPNSGKLIPTSKAIPSTNPFLGTGDDDDNSSYHKQSSVITQPIIKYDVPDPNRIPASVFARGNNAAGMDWSVASNESLFSIHVGNNSFSRDHVFLMGGPNDPFPPPPGSDDLSAESLDLRDQQTGGSQDGYLYVEATSPSSYKSFNLDKEQEMSGSDLDLVGTHTFSPALASRSTTSQRSDDCSSVQSFAFPILEGRIQSAKILENTNQSPHSHQYEKESKKLQEQPLNHSARLRRWTCCWVKRFPRMSCCIKRCC